MIHMPRAWSEQQDTTDHELAARRRRVVAEASTALHNALASVGISYTRELTLRRVIGEVASTYGSELLADALWEGWQQPDGTHDAPTGSHR